MAGAALIQPDTAFIQDVIALGGGDLKKCYQCATCCVSCELSGDGASFPRQQMIAAQWGLKERLDGDPGPWLCFYCGNCSARCPRGANPGETMMALRRYLTTRYDWTGLSARMYRSAAWEIGILALVAAVVVLLFTVPGGFGFGLLRHSSPNALNTVMLDRFAPKEIVHVADRILAMFLGLMLLGNAARMFRAVTRNKSIPASAYLARIPAVLPEVLTQRRWKGCSNDGALNWIRHVILVSGYATIFTLVVLFLPWFQVEDNGFHWTSLLGYYATAVLLGSTVWMMIDRAGKRTEMHRFSHLSDWLFPILLFLTALTGILLHVFRISNWAMPTYIMYMAHLAVAVPMLVVEVPCGKWAHLLYRPLAMLVAAANEQSDGIPASGVIHG